MSENTQLTDQELDTIIDILEENSSPDTDDLKKALEQDKEIRVKDVEVGEAHMKIDQDTGREEVIPQYEEEDADITLSEIIDYQLSDRTDELYEERLTDVVEQSGYELSDDEASQLMTTIMRYRAKEKFNVFKELPSIVQNSVRSMAAQSGVGPENYNPIACFIIDQFLSDANIDQEFIDFEKAINKEIGIPSVTDFYSEHIKDTMEIKLMETADRIQDIYPDKAEKIRETSRSFTDTYTMDRMKNHLKTNRKARNNISVDTSKYKSFCSALNSRMKKSSYKFFDVNMMGMTLNRVLPIEEVSTADIQNFVILFCKSCERLDLNDVADVSYVYYSIKNIIMLDYTEETKTEFSQNLITNIISMIEDIKEAQRIYEEKFPKSKKNKKK